MKQQPFRTVKVTEDSDANKVYDNLYVDINGTKIGEGTYGIVFKVEKVSNPLEIFALKKLRLTIKNKEEFLQSKKIRECNILLQMRPSNDHVVRYVDSFFDHLDHFYLITEYCDGGDLKKKIHEKKMTNKYKGKTEYFSNETLVQWMREILKGLDFLHDQNIIHRDIKPANILLKNGHIKIGDLGCAILSVEEEINPKTQRGTPAFMSPEMIKIFKEKEKITNKTDIWSAGVTFFQLITLKIPFKPENKDMRRAILNDQVPLEKLPQSPSLYKRIINKMLQKESTKRATAKEILQNFDDYFDRKFKIIIKSLFDKKNITENIKLSENKKI